jgi:predicted PurR-regulated permease PerM
MKQKKERTDQAARARPTPIRISRRTRNALIALGFAALVLLMWAAPAVPVMLLGGFALAMALSFPVRWLSRLMPRGLAIVATFAILLGICALAIRFLVPTLMEQLTSVVSAAPEIAREVRNTPPGVLKPLSKLGLMQGTPDQLMSRLSQDLVNLAQNLAQQVLGSLVHFVSGAFGVVLAIFGALFVAVYLLANVRRLKATYLRVVPKRYRQDARELWDAFAFSLTAIIPYLGAWLGAMPAVIVAFTVSPTTALLTALLYLVIQQLEGNILQPAIQGKVLNVPSILIFLAVIAGGQIAGLLGVIFAVPALAVLKVLFDFLRARLQTVD